MRRLLTTMRRYGPVLAVGAGFAAGVTLCPAPEAAGRRKGAAVSANTATQGARGAGEAGGRMKEAPDEGGGGGTGGIGAVASLAAALDAPGLEREPRLARWLAGASAAEVAAAAAWYGEPENQRRVNADSEYRLVLTRWLELDRNAAAQGPARGRSQTLRALAKLDPAAARAAAGGNHADFQTVIAAVGEEDPEAAVALLRELPAEEDAAAAWRGIMEGMLRRDPEKAARLAVKNGVLARESAAAWARQDPAAAAAWAEALESGSSRRDALDAVMGAWVAMNPEDALRKGLTLPPGERRAAWVAQAVAAIAAGNPDRGAALVFTLGSLAERERAGSMLAAAWAVDAPDRALALIRDLGAKSGFSRREGWMERTPVGYGVTDGTAELNEAVKALMAALPRETADMLAGLPASANAPVSAAVRQWVVRDTPGVAQWLTETPDAPGRDGAVEPLVETLIRGDLESREGALAWSLSTSDEKLRERLVTTSLQCLNQYPLRGSVPVLKTMTLSAGELERLREIIH